MTEREIKAKLESKMLELGADGPSFDTIVASGYRGALPHGVASDKRIEKGDMITLDFGAYYRGYCSDITRTFAIGEPDPKLKEIFNIVLTSQKKAIEQIKPGMTAKEEMLYLESIFHLTTMVSSLAIHLVMVSALIFMKVHYYLKIVQMN